MHAPTTHHWQSVKRLLCYASGTLHYGLSIRRSPAAELEWVQNLLHELHHPLATAPTLYSDNLSATYFSSNHVFHSRMKHLTLDYHFVRRLVQAGRLHVSYIPTTHQLADALTKPPPSTRFLLMRSKIGVVDTSSILRGRIRDK
ncbi:unnamed protein product [Linum trigynum]|uniref:Uncharacterized protein n=1 Tax=Linum trigynum TaxID=586398 RepID=A0AAV2CTS4_9ROSI